MRRQQTSARVVGGCIDGAVVWYIFGQVAAIRFTIPVVVVDDRFCPHFLIRLDPSV